MKIIITGDLVVNRPYKAKNSLSPSLRSLFESDFNIANLEAPVTCSSSSITKTGPHLKADKKSTLDVLKTLQIKAVTLANNHIMDYDEQGVKDTLLFCKQNGIETVGAGMNLEEAAKTYYIDSDEGKIAIINLAENEWASASKSTAGANPMNIIDNAIQIQEAKNIADYVIVIVHGGHEYYNLPSPRMQKQYRFYAEQGADLIVGHHTHCISGSEVHNGVPIYYSLGNFLFTKPSNYEGWYTGLVLELKIENRRLIPKIHPIEQEKDSYKLKLIEGKNKANILAEISTYDEIIRNDSKLEHEWALYIKTKSNIYLKYWSPLSFVKNRYLKGLLSRLGIKMINKKGMALALNLMRCETHRDMSQEVLKKYLNN